MLFTQKELDRTLVPVGVEEPLEDADVRQVCRELLHRYEDPNDPVINDAYLQEAFAAGLYGSPDAVKKGYLSAADGTAHIWTPKGAPEVSSKYRDGLEQMALKMQNGVRSLGGGIAKDALTTAINPTTGQGGGVLINQTVIPELSVWFNTEFTAWRDLPKVQATGLDYEWNNIIALGDDNEGFLDEEGCPVNAKGVFFRGRTNVALLGMQRNTSLKLDLAIRAGGVLYNGGMDAHDLELMNMMTVRARVAEKCYFQGVTASGHDAGDDEWGKTFTNGFNGWRVLTSGNANTVHGDMYPAGFTPLIFEVQPHDADTNPTPITSMIRKAITAIRNNGGRPTMIYMTYTMGDLLYQEYINFQRVLLGDFNTGVTAGGMIDAIASPGGPVPIRYVIDDSIGSYASTSIGTPTINGVTLPATSFTGATAGTLQDIYVASTGSLSGVTLGTPEPLPLEIPLGIPNADGTGCFTRRFLIYQFLGFAMRIPIHQAKIRVRIGA